jgi:hypothetical protein
MWTHAAIVREPKNLLKSLEKVEEYLKQNVGRKL